MSTLSNLPGAIAGTAWNAAKLTGTGFVAGALTPTVATYKTGKLVAHIPARIIGGVLGGGYILGAKLLNCCRSQDKQIKHKSLNQYSIKIANPLKAAAGLAAVVAVSPSLPAATALGAVGGAALGALAGVITAPIELYKRCTKKSDKQVSIDNDQMERDFVRDKMNQMNSYVLEGPHLTSHGLRLDDTPEPLSAREITKELKSEEGFPSRRSDKRKKTREKKQSRPHKKEKQKRMKIQKQAQNRPMPKSKHKTSHR